jgi:benzoyl-CoA 2,3-dioxygenase component A
VQDLIRERGDSVLRMLRDADCFIYVCGLKAMESGVLQAFRDVCSERGADWESIHAELLMKHRLHIETY